MASWVWSQQQLLSPWDASKTQPRQINTLKEKRIGFHQNLKLLLFERYLSENEKAGQKLAENIDNTYIKTKIVSRMWKELLRWGDNRRRHFSKEDIQMTSKHMNRCLIIREVRLKLQWERLPWCLMTKTPSSYWGGPRFDPWSRN